MRRLVMALAVLASAGMVPAAGATVVAGPNGPIVFTSGRDDGGTVLSNELAQTWILSGGTAQRVTTENTLHHRHPSWSPDRTKIAFAMGPMGFAGPWDIYVRDLTQPVSSSNPLQITNSASLNEDRPTWSPDGTMLTYEKQVAATQWNIVTKAATGLGGETTVAVDASVGMGASGQFPRPQWSPDGSVIYYGRVIAPGNYDIYRSPTDGSNVIGTAVVSGTTNDYQPALNADGTKLCFTREISASDKNVVVFPLLGGTIIDDLAPGGLDYECAWSPDGQRIAFTRGAFGDGELRVRNSDATGTVGTLTDVPMRFDGNAEWTYNPSPTCANGTASVGFNSFVSIPLSCSDQPDPPNFGPNSPFGPDIVTPPAHGVLGGISNDSVIYTPNLNFQGQDSFTFKSDDGTSDSAPATIAITVNGPVVNPPGAATVEALTMSPRRWRRGSALPVVSAAPKGTTIGVRLSAAGRVTLRFRRARPGRRVRGRCVRPTRLNRNRPRCTRYVRQGSYSFNGKQGANSVRFQGRLTVRKRLPLGRYRMFARVTANGQTSPSRRISFRIVRR